MTTNAQAALMAAASYQASSRSDENDTLNTAEMFKDWLDKQDAADRRVKGRVVAKRDLDAVRTAFGKTPCPEDVFVMRPGQLAPTQHEREVLPASTRFVTHEHGLAQGWVAERG